MASVYKRGQTYWIRFQWHGREVRRSARTTSKAVAQQYLAQVLEEHRRLDRGGRPRRSYKETLERFAFEFMPTLRPATQRRYRSSFRLLEPHFGDCYLDEINKTRLSDYVTARRRGGAMGATIRRDLATLSGVCSCAVAWDYIDLNPVKAFDKRHIREAPPRTSFPSEAEVERLVAHASPMVGRIIQLLAATGMRQEEAVSLEWSQVSIERREIRLTKTKTSSPRVVPLSDEALAVLIGTPRHITRHHVFWNGDGRRYTHFASQYRNIAKRAGVPWRCHDLRHRFASVFLMKTGDLAALQAILGHRTVAMTMRYSHLVTDHLHRAMAKLGTSLGTNTAESDEVRVGQSRLSH
ncbi:tyrosine-type recombinase/integrase [Methylobacterium nonmethylotrophicum]|uniref:Site-specific integrase n=1 Tax=Methylobacterium nonmethylotrophicum TaxID=1141884 RepID=A0A4Z0NH17_9HYPH|nr:site-specific integrase [Methylobacterium nonmethylotrophicum]TGD94957.1 site-specific integrase [Methylobacterium nonmethylotrophicum]